MQLSMDQYNALHQLLYWYRKGKHQLIEISGVVGTGVWEIVRLFLTHTALDPREVMYLSPNQHQVLELAQHRLHAYHLFHRIYNYTKITDIDTIPVVNPRSKKIEFYWQKTRRKIDAKYRLIVVLDSVMLTAEDIQTLSSYGLPVILLRDPMLLPHPDSYVFTREPNIELEDIVPEIMDPIKVFAHRAVEGKLLQEGTFGPLSVVNKKRMNLYNLKSADMVLTLQESTRQQVNQLYRERILHIRDNRTFTNERVICMTNMHSDKLVNPVEKRIKLYLLKGTVGHLTRCNRNINTTRYVGVEFRPDYYHESYKELVMDRRRMLPTDQYSRQIIPDECMETEYAYALTPQLARLSHWDHVTLLLDQEDLDPTINAKLLYTAISCADKTLTVII